MRERKRQLTHEVRVFNYSCRFAIENQLGQMLPEVVYQVAKAMDEAWSAIAGDLESSYEAWKPTWAGTKMAVDKNSQQTILIPAPTKEQKERYYAERDAFARAQVEELPDELGETLLDRLSACYKRLKTGGGLPRRKRGLKHFCLHHRFTGGGLPVERLTSERARRFRWLPPAAAVYQPQIGRKNPRALRRQRVAPCWFRVGEEILKLNAVLHRPLPADAIVKRVALVGRKPSVAMPWELALNVTVEVPKAEAPAGGGGVCGIDVGWRKLDDERMRVAVLYDGWQHHELIMPLRWRDRKLGEISLERMAGISAQRDQLLERAKKRLAELSCAQHPQARNGALLRLLRDPATPSAAIELLEKWKTDNDRYLRLARMVESRMRSHYEHAYHNWIAQHVVPYHTVRVEHMDQREMWAGGEQNPALKAAAERRKLAACGRFLEMVKQAVRKAGGVIEEVEAAHTTDVCSEHRTAFEAGPALLGRCANMHEKDQDWNASENIYANRGGNAAKARVA